ncbi:MAG: hypothetical protein QG656_2681, partial [Candidatus Hydrogenedentes bacterium]|nr:hypothetical protein [Candidatus Hydrogenedentota bacterium]
TNDAVLENDAVNGDIRAGQLSLTTTGIAGGVAEVIVRAEYVPRNISSFRFRFVTPAGMTVTADDIALTGLLAGNGWRIIEEGNNTFTILTDEGNYLRYGAFGDLLKVTFTGVVDEFLLGFRADNSIYSAPPNTTFFQYPLRDLTVSDDEPDVMAVALDDIYLATDNFLPDAAGAFDADGDGTRDFDDRAPLNSSFPPPLVAPTRIDFGTDQVSASLVLTNERFDALEWNISNTVPWLSVDAASPDSGVLQVGDDPVSVTLNASRAGLSPGVYNGMFALGTRAVGGVSVEWTNIYVTLSVLPDLQVQPESLAFPASVNSSAFTIRNLGTAPFNWTIQAVDPSNPTQVIPLPSIFAINPGTTGTTGPAAAGSDVTLVVNRTGLPVGAYDYMLRVTTAPDRGSKLIPIQVVVAGTPVLEVEPAGTLWMLPGENTKDITLRNTGEDLLTWSMSVTHNPATGPVIPVETLPITIKPASGAIEPAGFTEVVITADQVELLSILGEGNHTFRIAILWDRGTEDIALEMDLRPLPLITTDRTQLDFDTNPDNLELDFQIGNAGALYSELRYAFEVLGEVNANAPVIAGIFNDREISTGELRRTSPTSYPIETITVQIDRSVITDPVVYRTIRIYDRELAAVEPVEIKVRVQQAPLTIEGAINRSRPPSISRFVFLLRDVLGRAIPTITPEDRAKLSFYVDEDDIQLDPDETNHFVTGPENLKCNLVLLLDFTGSMYLAGTHEIEDPLEPGEAIERMVEGAKGFVDDLPDGYQVAIMQYHDVVLNATPQHWLIHGFTSDKAVLRQALEAFKLPAAEHGASQMRDALVGACDLLTAEDPPETLPFDDADIRAVVVVTDGWDTSSVNDVGATSTYAQDRRVRVYPIGFGGGATVNNSALVKLAAETGGHVYYAPTAESMGELLANDKGLALANATVDTATLDASFDVCDVGTKALPWSITYDTGSWLSVDLPVLSGTLLPGGCTAVPVLVDDTGLTDGVYTETIAVAGERQVTEGGQTVTEALDAVATATLKVTTGLPSQLTLSLQDEFGRVWHELRNQLVLTYVSLFQEGSHTYNITATYKPDALNEYEGEFERDGVFWPGDTRMGHVSMRTSGIHYVPNVQDYQAE